MKYQRRNQNLHVLSRENTASTYTFRKHVTKHRFCPTCGIAAINIRCIENIDLAAIPVQPFDERSL